MPVLEQADALEQLLNLPKEIRADVAIVMQLVFVKRYTGPITFHCKDGRPLTVEVLPPRIKLTED